MPLTYLFIGLLSLLPAHSYQADSVDTTSVLLVEYSDKTENLLSFEEFDGWKYQPGDSIGWAMSDYDDTHWHLASSAFSSADQLPDNFENGIGWWRMSFKADSTFLSEAWNLFFFTWGAAEVYVNGELVHSAGNFAVNVENEILNSALNETYAPIKLDDKTHVLAIRYSNHQVELVEKTFPGLDNHFGFNIGFSNHQYNESIISQYDDRQFIAVFSIAVLLVLILLHTTLYLKFREDKSNFFVAVFLMICLITVFFNFDTTFYEPSLLEYNLANAAVVLFASIAIFMMPYLIASILHINGYSRTIHLLWVAPLITLLHVQFIGIADFIQIGISVFSIGLTIKILLEARKKNRSGLIYIAAGGILPLIAICIYFLENLGYITIHPTLLNMLAIVIFTIFPFTLTLYIADRYGYLYSSLEREVKERTNELEEAYSELQQSLEVLKSTQDQLVQQEKLASLGQLTAGIAHEIKNPLNFVNNFSELSVELVEEAREEVKEKLSADSHQLTAVFDILDDIENNLRIIHQHGNRADGIVKSMLQHSRGGSGKMEPTGVNSVVKEFTNLAYHGMRAAKEPIDVEIKLDLQKDVGEIELITEDFSRVILNLCNNAFDAMRSLGAERSAQGEHYQPRLTVRTRRNDDIVTIEIQDNGPGIPDDIKDKILQPFFTTKKGTAGTGLGLSITNDIIKAHGGELNVKTSPSEGTTFTIHLKP